MLPACATARPTSPPRATPPRDPATVASSAFPGPPFSNSRRPSHSYHIVISALALLACRPPRHRPPTSRRCAPHPPCSSSGSPPRRSRSTTAWCALTAPTTAACSDFLRNRGRRQSLTDNDLSASCGAQPQTAVPLHGDTPCHCLVHVARRCFRCETRAASRPAAPR